jgi:guanylate kinase
LSVAKPSPDESCPLLIVLSGPSGAGKDAVLARMRELRKPYYFTVTATTRSRRPTERNGVDYIFLSEDAFRRMIDGGELLEWAKVYNNYYGVPKAQVADALATGHDVFIKVDVQGAATIKRIAPEALFIFLWADKDELARRLQDRMTESQDTLALRLKTAEAELQAASSFDYVVMNHRDRLDEAVEEIERIVARERRRTPPRRICL